MLEKSKFADHEQQRVAIVSEYISIGLNSFQNIQILQSYMTVKSHTHLQPFIGEVS